MVAKKYPDMVPEMLAYVLIVLWAQREYEEPAWRLYDEAFQDKAAATGNRKWSQIDTHIYNQIFTGRARKRLLCTHCSTATHDTEECPAVQPRWKRRMEEAIFGQLEEIPKGRKGVCWDFNDSACRYGDKCRFRHICSECAGRHPRSPAEELVLQRKGLLRWLVDPLRLELFSFEQRGTHPCNIIFSCKGHVITYYGHYHSDRIYIVYSNLITINSMQE